jgi:hypothetical protein
VVTLHFGHVCGSLTEPVTCFSLYDTKVVALGICSYNKLPADGITGTMLVMILWWKGIVNITGNLLSANRTAIDTRHGDGFTGAIPFVGPSRIIIVNDL